LKPQVRQFPKSRLKDLAEAGEVRVAAVEDMAAEVEGVVVAEVAVVEGVHPVEN
jgi:hypothetical protein